MALAAPLWRPLSYALAPELVPLVGPLTRLKVPLKGRPTLGFALGPPQPEAQAGLKPVLDVLEDPGRAQALPPGLLRFFQRAAGHYQAPLGQALAWALPAGLGAREGQTADAGGADLVPVATALEGPEAAAPRPETQAAQLWRRLRRQGPTPLPALRADFPRATQLIKRLEATGWASVNHRPLVTDLTGEPLWPEPEPAALSSEQDAAAQRLGEAIAAREFQGFLLFGVTGSGKTEVYWRAVRAALAAGRQALVLTPEIGLTLRLEGLLADRLGPEVVAALHSGLSPAQRRRTWGRIAAGQARVVVGARSAVFAPLADPGVICVDEEQDEAYKQEDRLRYHARDLALLRGQEQGCPVVLGTATPSVVSWHRARSGELELLRLTRRVKEARLPAMEVVDLTRAGRLEGGFLSHRLRVALQQTLDAGRQALLFLNRRGFAPALLCPACGHTVTCPHCSLALTWHQGQERLRCHVCGHGRPLPPECPSCGQSAEPLKPLGLGTEQVAAKLAEIWPGVPLARLDRDTAANPAQLRAVLGQVSRGEVRLVVGTQMITKGHHLPGIGLVGVLLADQAWAMPDFRAAERAWVTLVQTAGRAGREDQTGRVIVQAYDPAHHAVTAALSGDHEAFFRRELEDRQALGYPPFQRLVGLRVSSTDPGLAAQSAGALCRALERAQERLGVRLAVLGPAPAPVLKLKSQYRHLILIKAASATQAGRVLTLARHLAEPWPAGAHLAVDVDPLFLS